jgi:hypothetical protein
VPPKREKNKKNHTAIKPVFLRLYPTLEAGDFLVSVTSGESKITDWKRK